MIPEFAVALAMSVHFHTESCTSGLSDGFRCSDDMSLLHMPRESMDYDAERNRMSARVILIDFCRHIQFCMQTDSVIVDIKFFHFPYPLSLSL